MMDTVGDGVSTSFSFQGKAPCLVMSWTLLTKDIVVDRFILST